MPRSPAVTTRHAITSPQEQLRKRRALDLTRRHLNVTRIPPEVGQLLRPLVPTLTERLSAGIQADVSAYAGSATGRRHQLIVAAVHNAADHFVDIVENRAGSGSEVQMQFRQLGSGEAHDGHTLDAMRAAYEVVTRELWSELRSVSSANQLPNEQLVLLGDAILSYLQQLMRQVIAGYNAAHGDAAAAARRKLTLALTTRAPLHVITRLANAAQWQIPTMATVVVAESTRELHSAPANLPAHVLGHAAGNRVTFVVGAPDDGSTAAFEIDGFARIARSWPVDLEAIPDAQRWATQALDLASRGIIEDGPVIDCFQYRQLIWLHAEPTLSAQLHSEVLAPLLVITPYHRLNLAITLMLWLQTKASAPALARQLHVHVQTVHNRLRQLHGLFGSRLSDPAETLALLTALESVVPQWRAEQRRSPSTCAPVTRRSNSAHPKDNGQG